MQIEKPENKRAIERLNRSLVFILIKIGLKVWTKFCKSRVKFYFFKFVHNAIIHPLMSLPIQEEKYCIGRWILRLHDWTAERMA